MQSIAIEDIPRTSSIMKDFLRFGDAIADRFPGNTAITGRPEPFRREIAASHTQRDILIDAIRSTMEGLELSEAQKRNLETLAAQHSVTVTTGQQAGLFGGPLYTLYKAYSAVGFAAHGAEEYPEIPHIPVFWVEDNDHDIDEIATAALTTADYELQSITLERPNDLAKIHAADLRFDENGLRAVEAVQHILPQTEFSPELIDRLAAAYAPGRSVSEAFVTLLHYLLGSTGILFVSAARLRAAGAFGAIVRREFEKPGETRNIIDTANNRLNALGYHIQARTRGGNFFLAYNGERRKVLLSETQEWHIAGLTEEQPDLAALARERPDLFSPNVLLRPIVQDHALPNIATIVGPGEVAYMAQTPELYNYFGIEMPAFVVRHSATLIERKFAQFLERQGMTAAELMRPYDEVQGQVYTAIRRSDLETLFLEIRESLEASYQKLSVAITTLDATLEASASKTAKQALQGLEALQGRVRKTEKRSQEHIFTKLKRAHTLCYPKSGLQERSLAWITMVNKFGRDKVLEILKDIVSEPRNRHFFVSV